VVLTEEAFDLAGSDSRRGSDSNPLETIRLREKETSTRRSLRMLSSPGLEIVFAPDRPWAISVRRSEQRAPTVTRGLFIRDELHSLCLDANLLGQGLDNWGGYRW